MSADDAAGRDGAGTGTAPDAHGARTSRLRLRPAQPAGAAELLALSLRAIRGSASAHYRPAQLEAWAALRTEDGHRRMITDARTVVALDGDDADASRIVGFVTLRPDAGDEAAAEVDQLFVDPRAGGRGVARLLLGAARADAAANGFRRIHTHASWRAVPVFERCGYRQVRTETVHLGGQVLTRALMVAELPPPVR